MKTTGKNSCGCRTDLKKEIKGMVDQVESYGKEEHDKRKKEVEATFAEKKEKKPIPKKQHSGK